MQKELRRPGKDHNSPAPHPTKELSGDDSPGYQRGPARAAYQHAGHQGRIKSSEQPELMLQTVLLLPLSAFLKQTPVPSRSPAQRTVLSASASRTRRARNGIPKREYSRRGQRHKERRRGSHPLPLLTYIYFCLIQHLYTNKYTNLERRILRPVATASPHTRNHHILACTVQVK